MTAYTEQEYAEKGARIFLSNDQKSGYALTRDNDMISAFSTPKSHQGKYIVQDAVNRGAETLDCFDGKLPGLYEQFGFQEYQRYPWDDQYKPSDWNYKEFGRPELVMMRLKK